MRQNSHPQPSTPFWLHTFVSPFWEEKCFCKKERVWGDKCKWKGNIDLEAHTEIYSFTCSQKHNSAFTPFWSCLYCMPLCHMAFKVVSKLDLDDTLGDYDKFMYLFQVGNTTHMNPFFWPSELIVMHYRFPRVSR